MSVVAEGIVIGILVYFACLFSFGHGPQPSAVAKRCAERRGVAGIEYTPIRPGETLVICRDGTIHKVRP